MDWYIVQNGQPQKISVQSLIEKIENHEVPGTAWVFNENLNDWTPLNKTELWKTFSPPAPSPSPYPPLPSMPMSAMPPMHEAQKTKATAKRWIPFISIAIISLLALTGILTQGGLKIEGTTVVGFRGWSKFFTETLQIPAGITRIEDRAFEDCTKLTSVLLPSELIEIGDRAFANCTNLADINIPNRVSSIGYAAFQGCSSLTKIAIQGELESDVFRDCTSLEYVDISSSVECIPKNTFRNCINLVEVSLNHGTFEIGDSAFKGCRLLSKINIPNDLTVIGSEAFSGCTSLTSFRFPLYMQWIGSGAFFGCTSLTDVYFEDPNGLFHHLESLAAPPEDYRDYYLSEIRPDTFYGCTSLTSFIVPVNAETICDRAFCGCSNLESVILFNEDTVIASDAFQDCPKLTCLSYYQYSDNDYDYFLERPLETIINTSSNSIPQYHTKSQNQEQVPPPYNDNYSESANPLPTDDSAVQMYYTGDAYTTGLEIISRYEDSEMPFGPDVTFCPITPISNFCIVSFDWLENPSENDDILFTISQIPLYVGDVSPGQAIEASLYTGEFMPTMGYAYTDQDGMDHVFYIGESGRDGSLSASSAMIEQKIPPISQ